MRPVQLPFVHHASEAPLEGFVSNISRWGHGGVYAVRGELPRRWSYVYRVEGPFVVADIEDDETGSFHILEGYGHDEDFNALLRRLGPTAGLPASGPPWT